MNNSYLITRPLFACSSVMPHLKSIGEKQAPLCSQNVFKAGKAFFIKCSLSSWKSTKFELMKGFSLFADIFILNCVLHNNWAMIPQQNHQVLDTITKQNSKFRSNRAKEKLHESSNLHNSPSPKEFVEPRGQNYHSHYSQGHTFSWFFFVSKTFR